MASMVNSVSYCPRAELISPDGGISLVASCREYEHIYLNYSSRIEESSSCKHVNFMTTQS